MGTTATSDLEKEDETTRKIIRDILFVDPPTEFTYLSNEGRTIKIQSEFIIDDVWSLFIRQYIRGLKESDSFPLTVVQKLCILGMVSKEMQKGCAMECFLAGLFKCFHCKKFINTKPQVHEGEHSCGAIYCLSCITDLRNTQGSPPCEWCGGAFVSHGFFRSKNAYQDAPLYFNNLMGLLEIRCNTCEKVMTRGRMAGHYFYECQVDCNDGCGQKMTRFETRAHENNCPEVVINCFGSTVGCLYRCKRKDMNDHNLDCTYAKLAPMIMALEKRLQKVEREQLEDKNEIRSLQLKVYSLESSVTSLSSQVHSGRK